MRWRRTRRFARKVKTSIEHDGGSYLVEVTLACQPGDPGRTYGEPDDCYPSEPDSGEVEDILVVEVEDRGDASLIGKHVDWDVDVVELVTCAFKEQADEDEAAYEAWCESRLDAMREGDI
jgi:hypothetical protein